MRLPMNTFPAAVKHSEGWWIGWIEEVPRVNYQEPTSEELVDGCGKR